MKCFLALALLFPFAAAAVEVSSVDAPMPRASAAPMLVDGRVAPASAEAGGVRYQWPGVSFETAFRGDGVLFSVGPGDVILHVSVDGALQQTLVRPSGHYRVAGLGDGEHRVRIDVATESQAGANVFGGFLLPPGARPVPARARTRRIEFIGDSHTVGYGNLSERRDCSVDEVWSTTDNTRAFGPVVARHFDADHRIHAISGRGIVRNYDGGVGDTLPQAYPYVLFDHSVADADADAAVAWQPQVVVIALGTNDFSTPLKADERWASREALQADYRRTYVAFVQSLLARYPQASFVLWATDGADGEIRAQVVQVVEQLRNAGETRIAFVPVDGLEMAGCHWHPSREDHVRIADALIRALEAMPVSLW